MAHDQERKRRAVEKLNRGIVYVNIAQPAARPELTVAQATKIITEATDALQGNKKINAQNAFDIETADALVVSGGRLAPFIHRPQRVGAAGLGVPVGRP